MRVILVCLVLLLAVALPAQAAVDLNTATVSELENLPGIGPSKAAAIVRYRTEHGPFASLADLDNVPGIGAATLASLSDQLTVGNGGKPAMSGASGTTPSTPATPASRAPAVGGTCSVNINTADAKALERLPGISASKAAAILRHRQDHGAYANCRALDDVSGIGPSTVAGLEGCCRVK